MADGIIRIKKDDRERWVQVSHDLSLNKELSFAARGMMLYLLSRPNDWVTNVADLIKQSPAGRDAVYALLKELAEAGHVRRKAVRAANGKISHYETTVFETPQPAECQETVPTEKPDTLQPLTGKPETVKPDTARPDTARPLLLKNDLELLKNEEELKNKKPLTVSHETEHVGENLDVPPKSPAPDKKPEPRKLPTRIPEPFFLTKDMRDWHIRSEPNVDIKRETEKFTNHFRAASGHNAKKLDWVAAWRNWILEAADRQKKSPLYSGVTTNGQPERKSKVSKALEHDYSVWDDK